MQVLSKKIILILLLCLNVIEIILINYLPVGDWVSGPLIISIILIPMIVINIVLYYLYSKKLKNKIFVASIILNVFSLFLTIYYILIHDFYFK